MAPPAHLPGHFPPTPAVAWDSPAREVQDAAKELKNVLQNIECQENQARLIRPMISELRNELEKESSSRRRRHGDSESVR